MKRISWLILSLLICGCSSVQVLKQKKTPIKDQFAKKVHFDESIAEPVAKSEPTHKLDLPTRGLEPGSVDSVEIPELVQTSHNVVHVNGVRYVKESHDEKLQERKIASKKASASNIGTLTLNHPEKLYKFWIKYFTKKERARFIRHMRNGERYREIVTKIMNKHGLPPDLFYVGLIESGYNNKIKSRASAVGPWQFVKGTAVPYGLKVNRNVDERYNIHKSTEAAAKYFKDLYNIFGSWELALCAYNKGEYGVIRAIRKGNTRDYKTLVKMKLLPKETIYYVPKIAAARELVTNRKKYGFPTMKNERKVGKLYVNAKHKKMYSNFNWRKLSKRLGVPTKVMHNLNPEHKQRVVKASSRRPIKVYLPHKFDMSLAKGLFKEPKYVKSSRTSKYHKTYRVRKGDSLIAIAKRFNVPVSELVAVNEIKGRRKKIYAGQKLKISHRGSSKSSTKTYRVRRGDTLGGIAGRYGMTTGQIASLNNISSRKNIYVGQRLKVSKSSSQKLYRVKNGDNLSRIARRFGVSVKQIVSHNSLASNKIYRGQKLYIPTR